MKKTKNKEKKPTMWKRVRIIVFLLLLSAMAFGYFHFFKKTPVETDNEKIVFQKQGELTFLNQHNKTLSNLDIEIAATEYTRERGLMARSTMGEHQGMLFRFDAPSVQSFWMKNTILPLDIVFVNENDQVIHIGYNAVPFSEALISSEKPAMYVVEVNAGYCKKFNIEVGDKIQWRKIEEEVKP
jgi:uncharacterized protein